MQDKSLHKTARTFVFASILLPLCLFASCSEAEDKYYIMDSLRVMAIKADKPWLHFGESTTLEALVFAPNDAEVSYQWRWCPTILNSVTGYACPLDQNAFDALVEQASEGELSAPSLDLGTSASATFDNVFPGELLTAICYGALEGSGNIGAAEIDCASTYAISIILEVQTAEETIRAVKDLKLIIDPTLVGNQNPAIIGLSIGEFDSTLSDKEIDEQKESIFASAESIDDEDSFSISADKNYVLFAELPEDAVETYIEPSPEDTSAPSSTEEALIISWFIELGELDSTRTGYVPGEINLETASENLWTPPIDLSDYEKDSAKIYVVIRDDRGGSSWLQRHLDVSALGDVQ